MQGWATEVIGAVGAPEPKPDGGPRNLRHGCTRPGPPSRPSLRVRRRRSEARSGISTGRGQRKVLSGHDARASRDARLFARTNPSQRRVCSSMPSRTWSILRAPRAQYRCSIVSETLWAIRGSP